MNSLYPIWYHMNWYQYWYHIAWCHDVILMYYILSMMSYVWFHAMISWTVHMISCYEINSEFMKSYIKNAFFAPNGQINAAARANEIPDSFVAQTRMRFRCWLVLSDSFLFQFMALRFLVNVLLILELNAVWFIELASRVWSLVLLDCWTVFLSNVSIKIRRQLLSNRWSFCASSEIRSTLLEVQCHRLVWRCG